MTAPLTEYTFTFDKSDEGRFRSIMERLDDDEFVVKQDITRTDPTDRYNGETTAVIEMSPEAASTFRFGMKQLVIRRTRTEEELAEEEAEAAKNRVTITVKVDGLAPPTP